jgi:hypothetical protein
MTDLIATDTNLATAEGGLVFQRKTILGPPYNTPGWSKWIEPASLPPGFSHSLRLDLNTGDIVVQLFGRPPAGRLVFKAGFKYVFTPTVGGTEVFQALLDTSHITVRPAGSAVKTYGEISLTVPSVPISQPLRDTFPLQAKRPTLLSVASVLIPGYTFALTFGVVIDMTVSGGEVYTEVIAPARYAERRQIQC